MAQQQQHAFVGKHTAPMDHTVTVHASTAGVVGCTQHTRQPEWCANNIDALQGLAYCYGILYSQVVRHHSPKVQSRAAGRLALIAWLSSLAVT